MNMLNTMDGWMDGWVGGWVGGWMDGWVGGGQFTCSDVLVYISRATHPWQWQHHFHGHTLITDRELEHHEQDMFIIAVFLWSSRFKTESLLFWQLYVLNLLNCFPTPVGISIELKVQCENSTKSAMFNTVLAEFVQMKMKV